MDEIEGEAGGFMRNPYDTRTHNENSNAELEKAIQASLQEAGGMGGGVVDAMHATMDDEEFKRILERSKQEK